MGVIYIMIGASLLIAVFFLLAFLWSVRSGQMEDTVTPSIRMLFDDSIQNVETDKPKQQNSNT